MEQNRINRENAELILNPKFIPVYPEMIREWYSYLEWIVFWFIDFFLSNNERFYCSNEQLWTLLWVSDKTISIAIKKLKDNWLIDVSYKIKAGWGQVRFIKNVNSDFTKMYSQNLQKCKRIENKEIENNNISTKVDIYTPKKKSTTSEKKKRTTNEHLLVWEKKEQFEKFWKTYPHYQSRSDRKNSIPYFLKLDIQQVMLWATLLKREIQVKPEQQNYVKASERWLKNFTPISESQKQTRLNEIFIRHMKKWWDDMKERMNELKQDFPDVDFKPMLYEYQKSKSLLNNLKFT
jgi:hypothetical protein